MTAAVRHFNIDVPQAKFEQIAAKLALSEAGYAPAEDADWKCGTDAVSFGELLTYWRSDYDWRAAELALNKLPHFKAVVDEIDVHFIHVRAPSGYGKIPALG